MLHLKSRSWWLIGSVVLLVLASGCSPGTTEEQGNEEQQTDASEEPNVTDEADDESSVSGEEKDSILDAPEPPETLDDLLAYPVGQFAGQPYSEQQEEIEAVLDELPPMEGEEANPEELHAYWAKLVSLFAEAFPDPADIVRQWGAASFGSPETDDPRLQFKDNYNVQILLDASGSMAAQIGGKSMMDIAKQSITEFAEALPEGENVALRVYGHKGSNARADKQVSCESSELVYELQPYDAASLQEAMDQFGPTGWTPLARSIELAQEDLAEYDGEHNTNIVYLVSDGVETCGGDPVQAAKDLGQSDITPIVNVIGFDVDSAGQKQLKEVARSADGTYALVQNQDQLKKELDRAQEMARAWEMWKAEAISEAGVISADRTQMLREYETDWAERRSREDHNFHEAFEYLISVNAITPEQASVL